MRILRTSGLVAAALVLATSGLQGQRATEKFIPVGQSPGVSGAYAWLGEVVAFDGQARTVTVRNDQGSRTIRLTDTTSIWLDRSRLRQAPADGTPADLQAGRTVEIKYVNRQQPDAAEWIKIVIEEG